MTDLERVRDYCKLPVLRDELATHLKEDAEREDWSGWAENEMVRLKVEIARLGEKLEAELKHCRQAQAELAKVQYQYDELQTAAGKEVARLREENEYHVETVDYLRAIEARYTELLEAVEALFDAAHPGLVDARFPEQAARLRQLIEEADHD